jgi:PAS domain S-box-containing protein
LDHEVNGDGEEGSSLYTIGEVAAMLGVSAHTIRAWERRHGIVHPVRTPTKQRRYRAEDVELLRHLRQVMEQGGLSLRLAYMTVTGAIEPAEPGSRKGTRGGGEPVALSSDASLWQMVSDALPDLILIIDRDGRIVESNVAVARTFGGVRQRYVGREFSDLVEQFDRSKARMLYRPQLRVATAWELNLSTPHGSRLYSFNASRVRQGDRDLLALVGSPTFGGSSVGSSVGARQQSAFTNMSESAPSRVLERVIERLPFGVAVASVGADPRIVYANPRLYKVVRREAGGVAGQRVRDLLPPEASAVFKRVVETHEAESLRALPDSVTAGRRHDTRLLSVDFRPLFSAHMKVTGVLIVVEDETREVEEGRDLERMVADTRMRDASTARELIEVGLVHAVELIPGSEVLIQLVRGRGAHAGDAAIGSTGGWRISAESAPMGIAGRIASQVAARGTIVDVSAQFGGQPFRVIAIPLIARAGDRASRYLGTILWRYRAGVPARRQQDHLRQRLVAFAEHFSLAVELMRLRAEVRRKEALLDSASNAAAVIREPNTVGEGLGDRFLERLASAVGADAASLGRIEGRRFVLLAAYRGTPATPPMGHAFQLMGGFVTEAIRTGEPTATSRLETIQGVAPALRRDMLRMKHALAVPLIRDVTVIGVIVLLRAGATAFSDEEVALVQMLSGIGVLSVSAGFRMRTRRSAGA